MANKDLGLYIHVPFCRSKCPYCDFYSIKYSASTADDYKNAVLRNISAYDEVFDTVYFGGGTPILLYNEIADILKQINSKISANAEITIEANPESTTKEALEILYESGVNRVSFGVQSLNDDELLALGRLHNSQTAINSIIDACEIGFKNISADLMLGIPYQNRQSLYHSINELAKLPITHISAYMLKIEEGTGFYKNPPKLPDEDFTSDLYILTCDELEKNGFFQYEISNFAKRSFESKHNLKYWDSEEYIGIGPSSHSFYGGRRFAVLRNLREFIEMPLQNIYITEENPKTFDEWAMLKLRLSKGILFDEIGQFGVNKDELINKAKIIPKQLINIDETGIYLTKEGFLLSNNIIEKLIF